jgi:hypothetical protein
MRIFHALSLIILTCFSFNVFAQSTTVKGLVVNDAGDPLSGISILVKNAKQSSITDSTGTFLIQVLSFPANLVFTGVGYHQQEYILTEKILNKSIKITLHKSSSVLDEVVVVGYGTARKESISGLSGRAAGISIRGTSSVSRSPVMETERVVRKATPLSGTSTPGSNILTAGELSDFKKWKLYRIRVPILE